MFYARFRDTNGIIIEGVYEHRNELKALTGAEIMGLEILKAVRFDIKGHTYADRKDWLRNLAIYFQNARSGECDIELSYMETSQVEHFFRKNGRRYGLLREFQENAIC